LADEGLEDDVCRVCVLEEKHDQNGADETLARVDRHGLPDAQAGLISFYFF